MIPVTIVTSDRAAEAWVDPDEVVMVGRYPDPRPPRYGWVMLRGGQEYTLASDPVVFAATVDKAKGHPIQPPPRPPHSFVATCGICGVKIGGDGDVCNRCATR